MPDGLSVIRRIAGLSVPAGPAPASGADAVEAAVLTQSLQALDALPRVQPDDSVLAQIAARALDASEVDALSAVRGACGLGPAQPTVEGAVLAQSLAAMDALPASLPTPEAEAAVSAHAKDATFAPLHSALSASGDAEAVSGVEEGVLSQSLQVLDALPAYAPSPEALDAVLARAAQFQPPVESPASGEIEEEVARQSESALASLPTYSPSADAVAAVLARAQEATFAPLLEASGEGEATGVEAQLLRQSLLALDALPAYAPSAAVLSAIEGAALNATFAPLHAAYGDGESSTPEAGLLAQSKQILDAVPAYAPSEAALAAVFAAAASASSGTPLAEASAATPALRQRRASDREAVRAARPRKMRGIVAGVATLAVAILAAVTLLDPGLGVVSPETEMVASADIVETTPAPAAEESPVVVPAPEEPQPELLAVAPQPPRPVVQRSAPRGPSAEGFQPAVARQAAPAPTQTPRAAQAAREAAASDLADATFASSEATTEWEAGEDVRLLSLRLKQLREQNTGLEWDEPAVAFGGASGAGAGTTPGIQAVRETAPLGRALVRSRTPSTDR